MKKLIHTGIAIVVAICFASCFQSPKASTVVDYVPSDEIEEMVIQDTIIDIDAPLEITLFYGFLDAGINNENVLQEETRFKIESTIGRFYSAEDFDTPAFYKREVARLINMWSEKQIEEWGDYNSVLHFEAIGDSNLLDADWRYPINKIESLAKVMNLYKDVEYGDSIYANVPYYHMALYMFLVSPTERDSIVEEIQNLRDTIS